MALAGVRRGELNGTRTLAASGRAVQRALELDESRRAEFLESSCRGDEALRREVESLLAQEKRVNHFLQ